MIFLTTPASSRKLYAALGVSDKATTAQIRAQFLNISRTYHPDIIGYSHPVFGSASEAYRILMDPETRKVYDLSDDTGNTADMRSRSLGIIRSLAKYLIVNGKVTGNLRNVILEMLTAENNAQLESRSKTDKFIKDAKTLRDSVRANWDQDTVKQALEVLAEQEIVEGEKQLEEIRQRLVILETAHMLVEKSTYNYIPSPPPVRVRDYRTMRDFEVDPMLDLLKNVMITFPYGSSPQDPTTWSDVHTPKTVKIMTPFGMVEEYEVDDSEDDDDEDDE